MPQLRWRRYTGIPYSLAKITPILIPWNQLRRPQLEAAEVMAMMRAVKKLGRFH
jgi:hypothetical protein